jgi:hypothetical protein
MSCPRLAASTESTTICFHAPPVKRYFESSDNIPALFIQLKYVEAESPRFRRKNYCKHFSIIFFQFGYHRSSKDFTMYAFDHIELWAYPSSFPLQASRYCDRIDGT